MTRRSPTRKNFRNLGNKAREDGKRATRIEAYKRLIQESLAHAERAPRPSRSD